jgi:hypothetical protein
LDDDLRDGISARTIRSGAGVRRSRSLIKFPQGSPASDTYDRSRPQPAVQQAGEPAVGTAALLRYLTDELRAQFGHSGRWRDHPPTTVVVSIADVEYSIGANGRFLCVRRTEDDPLLPVEPSLL